MRSYSLATMLHIMIMTVQCKDCFVSHMYERLRINRGEPINVAGLDRKI